MIDYAGCVAVTIAVTVGHILGSVCDEWYRYCARQYLEDIEHGKGVPSGI